MIVIRVPTFLIEKNEFKFSLFVHCRRYEEETENTWNCGSWFEYLLIVILSTILLIGVLVLTLFWVIYYRGGFAWTENPTLQFNLHPVLMIAGFITFSGFCKYIYFAITEGIVYIFQCFIYCSNFTV